MMRIVKIIKRLTLGFVLAGFSLIGGCGDNTISWQEEVKLLDGRVITVSQKRRIDEENIEREAWVMFKLPEIGNQEIVWHESLEPQILNIFRGKLYVVGQPATEREFRQYGSPKPTYVGYRFEDAKWVRIPFSEIPIPIYDSNLYFENMAITKLKHVSLADKEELINNDRYGGNLKRIDPNYVAINY